MSSPVSVYEHIYYNGSSSNLEVGNYILSDLQNLNIINDDISSLKEKGYKATIYEHDNYQGKSLVLTSNTPNLVLLNWNDIISSIKVEELSTTQSVSIYENTKYTSISLLIEKTNGILYIASGFIIKNGDNYYICTVAYNVLEGSRTSFASKVIASITTIDGINKAVECTIIGVAAYGDLAILKINDESISNLTHLIFATNEPNIGDKCYVIGDPKGVDAISISEGIVRDNKFVYGNIIKSVCISASIYGGNSGSPVLNENGEVISIISYGIESTDTISWGASSDVIQTVINNRITNYENTNTIPSNFIGGTLNTVLYPVDSYYLYIKNKIPYDLTGFYVNESTNGNLSTNDIITILKSKKLGVYEGQSTPVDIYLNPNTALTMDILNITNNNTITKTLTTSPLNSSDDIYLNNLSNENVENIILRGHVKK